MEDEEGWPEEEGRLLGPIRTHFHDYSPSVVSSDVDIEEDYWIFGILHVRVCPRREPKKRGSMSFSSSR